MLYKKVLLLALGFKKDCSKLSYLLQFSPFLVSMPSACNVAALPMSSRMDFPDP